ncbi:hypothetical protein DN730_07995 [Marinomonas piezotolerans]|uniref:Uncharacterized protein n=1 Tax=Marinomonas piezotolerans TaxID=2213058 RepID=A0A370U980_9GAMM|nr:hypothetical protein [Marinomonas piezotolerans]RDL44337.1 hypothetical protein DN730_07995 [Marinomonas piezotolerans]
MPAPKPLNLHHLYDWRPRFDEETHQLLLQLTAEMTRLNGGDPVPKNVVLRAIAEYQLERLGPADKQKILTAIHCS